MRPITVDFSNTAGMKGCWQGVWKRVVTTGQHCSLWSHVTRKTSLMSAKTIGRFAEHRPKMIEEYIEISETCSVKPARRHLCTLGRLTFTWLKRDVFLSFRKWPYVLLFFLAVILVLAGFGFHGNSLSYGKEPIHFPIQGIITFMTKTTFQQFTAKDPNQ